MSLFGVRVPRWEGETPLCLFNLRSLLLPYDSSDWKWQAFLPLEQPALQPFCGVERTSCGPKEIYDPKPQNRK